MDPGGESIRRGFTSSDARRTASVACSTRVVLRSQVHLDRGYEFTLLVAHGNAEDLGQVARLWDYYANKLKVNIFAYEYTGYGHATGSPSEEALYSDARAALGMLINNIGLDPATQIILLGKVRDAPSLRLP